MHKYYLPITLLFFCFGMTFISNAEEKPAYNVQPAPEILKHFLALEGEWQGTHKNHEGIDESIKLVYRTVSGGTAIEERIFAGTPQEMVTMYHGNGKEEIVMTHYCALGNQPRLKLSQTDGKQFEFNFLDGVGIDRETTGHMGGMKITLIDDNTILQEWAYYEDGEEKSVSAFTFTRR